MKRKLAARLFVFAWFFIGGVSHLLMPAPFLRIMPPYIPFPLEVVYLSGVLELMGAVGLLLPEWRSRAGIGLILLTLGVTLANLHMLQHAALFPDIPYWLLVARLPLQAGLLWLIWWSSRPVQQRPCLMAGQP